MTIHVAVDSEDYRFYRDRGWTVIHRNPFTGMVTMTPTMKKPTPPPANTADRILGDLESGLDRVRRESTREEDDDGTMD